MFNKNKEKNNDVVTFNSDFYNEFFKEFESFYSKLFGQMLAMNGVGLNELDEDIVKMWNSSMEFYKKMKNECLSWAMLQDGFTTGLLVRFSRMEQKEDKILELLEKLEKKE